MMLIPLNALAGVNILPDMPGPLNVPPDGEPINVTALSRWQYEGLYPLIVSLGRESTTTQTVVSLEQPDTGSL